MSLDRRSFLQLGSAAALGAAVPGGLGVAAENMEWRNKTSGMKYRRLGRTGFMVSVIVHGGVPMAPGQNDQCRLALDMGLNYLDSAPAYGNLQGEMGYGEIVKQPSMRDRVFITTKVSVFDVNRGKNWKAKYDELPESERKVVDMKVRDRLEARGVMQHFYLPPSLPGAVREIEAAYRSNVMEELYGDKNIRKTYKKTILDSLDGSLQRLQTDHVDLFFCPHGCSSPEELQIPEILEAFEVVKKAGKTRFFGFSAHSDPAGALKEALKHDFYSAAMVAYNVGNMDWVNPALDEVRKADFGIIAMKVARAVHPDRNPRSKAEPELLDKINRLQPGDMHVAQKAYIQALKHPAVGGCVSSLKSVDVARSNLSVVPEHV